MVHLGLVPIVHLVERRRSRRNLLETRTITKLGIFGPFLTKLGVLMFACFVSMCQYSFFPSIHFNIPQFSEGKPTLPILDMRWHGMVQRQAPLSFVSICVTAMQTAGLEGAISLVLRLRLRLHRALFARTVTGVDKHSRSQIHRRALPIHPRHSWMQL